MTMLLFFYSVTDDCSYETMPTQVLDILPTIYQTMDIVGTLDSCKVQCSSATMDDRKC